MGRQTLSPVGLSDWKLAVYTKEDLGIGLHVIWFELHDSIGRAPILGFINPPQLKTLLESAATDGVPEEIGLYGARSDARLKPLGKEIVVLDVTVGSENVNLMFDWIDFCKAFDEL